MAHTKYCKLADLANQYNYHISISSNTHFIAYDNIIHRYVIVPFIVKPDECILGILQPVEEFHTQQQCLTAFTQRIIA